MSLRLEGPRWRPVLRCGVAVVVVIAGLAGCSGDDSSGSSGDGDGAGGTTAPRGRLAPELVEPEAVAVVLEGGSGAEYAAAASEALFATAPVVVLAAEDDLDAQVAAAPVAVGLGMPLLLTPAADETGTTTETEGTAETEVTTESEGTAAADPAGELARLAPRSVLAVGDGAAAWADGDADGDAEVVPAPADAEALAELAGLEPGEPGDVTEAEVVAAVAALDREAPSALTLTADDADDTAATTAADGAEGGGDGDAGELVPTEPAAPLEGVAVLVAQRPEGLGAVATARAAGAVVVPAADRDPRADPAAIETLSAHEVGHVVAVGAEFGPPEQLWQRTQVAATGVELPGGGQVLFPGRRMAALYGNPTTAALGVLGEQGLEESIARAQDLAAQYDDLVDEPVVPTFELIATVASSEPGPDGNYANESDVEDLRPWIDAAGEAGVYVVLDIQPGRTDFLTQSRRYQDLLAEPHVGLALDPEWRLEPNQVHMEQIGTVGADEVNQVADWLADLTQTYELPQKLLLLHQFRSDMLADRGSITTDHDELAVLIHADGFGTPGQKFETWDRLLQSPPPNVWWGWKNFVDEDQPTFTPAQTVAIDPSPVFVSYQ